MGSHFKMSRQYELGWMMGEFYKLMCLWGGRAMMDDSSI